MQTKMKNKGFTLIELLVVIAIIGILASVVLVSLNSARLKGKDSRVISDVQQLRTEAESKYNGTNYGATFNNNAADTLANGRHAAGVVTGTITTQLLDDAAAQQTGGQLYAITNGASPTAYAIYGRLASNPDTYFCIDSTGNTDQSVLWTNAVTSLTLNITCP